MLLHFVIARVENLLNKIEATCRVERDDELAEWLSQVESKWWLLNSPTT